MNNKNNKCESLPISESMLSAREEREHWIDWVDEESGSWRPAQAALLNTAIWVTLIEKVKDF